MSTITVYDALGRPEKVRIAADTPLESWTQTEYDDANRRVTVRSDIDVKGDGRKVSSQFYDQLGRVRLSKTLEDAATQSATNETDGIKVQTRYLSPNGYTYQLTSNPYRANYSSGETDTTMGWTRSKAWANTRRSEVETFAGAGLPEPWGTNFNSTGVVKTEIESSATTVIDQAGKLRRSITNALGQLSRVDEPNGSNQLGSLTSPNQPTDYTYDLQNNLLTVSQIGSGTEQCGPSGGGCSQTRTFTYSSLSRLISATNPESGIIGYRYDPNGNLSQKTDARGVQTDYIYDQLNRVKNRNYSTPSGTPQNYQASPNVTYTYDDPLIAHSKGKLTKVSTGNGPNLSTTEYVSFDILGRVTRSKQTTDGVVYGDDANPMTYTYNLSGALIEQRYPSGRVVKNILDSDGELATVQSKKNANHAFWNYANHFTYNAAGAVTSMQLGNGRWESTQFNSRLQPTQIALGKTAPYLNAQGQPVYSSELLKLNYEYGELYPGTGNTDFTKNNGNISKQTITVQAVGATPGFEATQYYAYDSLNRIEIATENITPDGQPLELGWRQHFKYDRYGNRNFVTTGETATTTLGTCPTEVCNPSICPNNNKITSTGYEFDAAGNTTRDAQDRKFTYDAENKQTKVETLSGETVTGTVGEYWYDGDGRRIKKRAYEDNVPTEETIFLYDATGKLIGEYSNQVASSQEAKVAYLTNDHLGSPRINTDINANVTARHDYHPFGEEVASSTRVSALGYAADTVRKQFTGYERDYESDLAYARARYYVTAAGRFSSPDPLLASGRTHVPGSWNRYLYVLGNPLRFNDPTGMFEYAENTSEKDKEKIEKGYSALQKARDKFKPGSKQYKAIDRALKALGAPGEKNGVTLFVDNTQKKPGTAIGSYASADGKATGKAEVFIGIKLSDFTSGDSGTATLAGTLGHEGSHAADFQSESSKVAGLTFDQIAARSAAGGVMTRAETEVRAYRVSAFVAEAISPSDVSSLSFNGYEVWNRGWSEVDREKNRENGIRGALESPTGSYKFRYQPNSISFPLPYLNNSLNNPTQWKVNGGPIF